MRWRRCPPYPHTPRLAPRRLHTWNVTLSGTITVARGNARTRILFHVPATKPGCSAEDCTGVALPQDAIHNPQGRHLSGPRGGGEPGRVIDGLGRELISPIVGRHGVGVGQEPAEIVVFLTARPVRGQVVVVGDDGLRRAV